MLLVLLHTWLAAVYLWRQLVRNAVPLSLTQTCVIFFSSQIAKYIPGRVWGIIFQVNLANLDGAAHAIVVGNLKLTYVVTTSMMVLSATVVAAFLSPHLAWVVLLTGLLASLLLLRYGGAVLVWLLPQTTRKKIEDLRPANGRLDLLEFVVWSFVLSVSAFSSIAIFIYSVFVFDSTTTLMLTAYQGIAWVVSNLVAIVPAGIGIREGLVVLLNKINTVTDLETVILVAIVIRLIQLIADVILGAIAYVLKLATAVPD
jgi:hypothetical protein